MAARGKHKTSMSWLFVLITLMMLLSHSKVSWCYEDEDSDLKTGSPETIKNDLYSEYLLKHLGTKTPYYVQKKAVANHNGGTPVPEGCKPIHLKYVGRHGVRKPQTYDVQQLTILKNEVMQHADVLMDPRNEKFRWMLEWAKNSDNEFGMDDQGRLAKNGEKEQYNIAKRFKSYFPRLFKEKYSPSRYTFQSTQYPRAGASASSFAYGLFQSTGKLSKHKFQPVFVSSETRRYDYKLRFFEMCDKFNDRVKEYRANSPAKSYSATVYKQVAKRLDREMGLQNHPWASKPQTINGMFIACSFDVSVYSRTDRWCSLFAKEEITMFEYLEDYNQYMLKGYGDKLNYEISCPLLDYMISGLDKIANNQGKTFNKADLMFAHSETVMPLLSLLGLFKDDQKLDLHMSSELKGSRKWKTSKICPFAANVALVLYQCSSDAADVIRNFNNKESLKSYEDMESKIVDLLDDGEDAQPGKKSDCNDNDADDECGDREALDLAKINSNSDKTRSGDSVSKSQFMVKLMVNEVEYPVPDCNEKDVDNKSVYCPLERFAAIYKPYLGDKCRTKYESLCGVKMHQASGGKHKHKK